MTGRIGYFLIAGAAIFAGMVVQGDVDLESELGDRDARVVSVRGDRDIDRRIDRIVDRATMRIEIGGDDGEAVVTDPGKRKALIGAVAELVRAETSLVAARNDDNQTDAMIEQAEQRRDLAREAVERIADDTRSESRGNRDALRQNIRDEVRDSVREGARS